MPVGMLHARKDVCVHVPLLASIFAAIYVAGLSLCNMCNALQFQPIYVQQYTYIHIYHSRM